VASVLRATAKQLSRVGYAALRVEEVAEASGVNKTTIYRRWPTKPDLVIAALREAKAPAETVEVGDLRTDVLAWLHETLSFANTPVGKGIIRVVLAERGQPELAAIAKALRKEQQKLRVGLVTRAIERGDLPAGTDPELLSDLLFIPIITRAITFGDRIPDGYIERAVDIILAGARADAAPSSSRRLKKTSNPPRSSRRELQRASSSRVQ
jgi:AcrR family transcriptional regulator